MPALFRHALVAAIVAPLAAAIGARPARAVPPDPSQLEATPTSRGVMPTAPGSLPEAAPPSPAAPTETPPPAGDLSPDQPLRPRVWYAGGPLLPPPPEPHVAPSMALWAGLRAGFELPFGDAFTDAAGVPFSERNLRGSGPTLEFDLGGRFARKLLPYFFYVHTFAATGNGRQKPAFDPLTPPDLAAPAGAGGAPVASSTVNLLGVAFRYEADPDGIGPTAEVGYAYRLTRATLASGQTISADAAGEVRLGLGATFRLSPLTSIAPMLVAGAGSYTDVTMTGYDGHARNVVGSGGVHGYVGLDLGVHADLFGVR